MAPCHSRLGLLEEGGGTAGADGDFTLQHTGNGRKLLFRAEAVNEDVCMLAGNGGHRLVFKPGALGVDHRRVANQEILACGAGIVHGRHAQGIGIGAGRANHIHAHIIGVEIPGVSGRLHPGASVTGCNGHHNAGLGQPVQNRLVFRLGVSGRAGVRGTQGQVDRIALQNNGVLNGHQIIGIVSAAGLAKHLHGDELGIGGHTLNLHCIQCVGKCSISVGDVGIGRGNTGHVGAMLSLLVSIMGDVQVLVHIVVAKGELGVEIQLLCSDAFANMKLIQHPCNLFYVQKIIICYGFASLFRLLLQRVIKASRAKGLMVRIRAGVNDGNPGCLLRCNRRSRLRWSRSWRGRWTCWGHRADWY